MTLGNAIVFIFMIYVFYYASFSYDDTDDKENKKRSGIVLMTDYGTGNQWIKVGLFGKFQKRLDVNGNQVNIYSNPSSKLNEK